MSLKTLVVFRLFNPTYGVGVNKKTLIVNVNEDSSLLYSFFDGWESSGASNSLLNLQLKTTFPVSVRGFKKTGDLVSVVAYILSTGCGSNKISHFEIENETRPDPVVSQCEFNLRVSLGQRLDNGRDYLMTVDPKKLTVEDCFRAFGWSANGLREEVWNG